MEARRHQHWETEPHAPGQRSYRAEKSEKKQKGKTCRRSGEEAGKEIEKKDENQVVRSREEEIRILRKRGTKKRTRKKASRRGIRTLSRRC